MEILVSGGAGYIGSHTCIALIEAGYSVVVVDNLTNSKRDSIETIKTITSHDIPFYEIDITNKQAVEHIFINHKIQGVIHCAGLKAVGESVEKPLTYYENNIVSTLVLANCCLKFGVNQFVFSSSATVYGENEVPFVETMDVSPTTNPYGETKAICERILNDIVRANSLFSVSILRYFNPVGAHESGLIGEAPNGTPNNLMPYITQVAKGRHQFLSIFGNDYPTLDGTGVRDYIHMLDLAEGHVAALSRIRKGIQIYNLGTGQGTSVLELVKAFEVANGVSIPFKIVDRRPGDIAACYADVQKANRELEWIARRDVKKMCEVAWKFEQNYNHQVV